MISNESAVCTKYSIQFFHNNVWCNSSWHNYSSFEAAVAIYEDMTGPNRSDFAFPLPSPENIRLIKNCTYLIELNPPLEIET